MITPSRRVITLICAAVLICTFLVSTAAAQECAERITLEVVLTKGRDPNVNIVQDYGPISWAQLLTQEFQKEYPCVDVLFRMGSLEQVTVQIATGGGPDIINGAMYEFINLGRQGAFVNLLPLFERDGIDYLRDEIFWPPQWEAFSWKGEQFAVPQYLGTIAMYYNVDLWDDTGYPRPEPRADLNTMDWYEFEAIAKKLTRDTDGDGVPNVWGFYKWINQPDRLHYWLAAAGSDFFGNEERTVSTLDNPHAIEAIEFLQSLRWQSRVVPPAGIEPSFINGEVAIWEEGSWQLVNLLGRRSDGSPKVAFRWNVFPMPLGPSGKRYTLATTDGYAINRNTKHLEEAYALLKFLCGPVANEIKAKYLALQPAHRYVVPEYISLMRELNRDVYNIDVFVFTEAGPYALPEVIYSEPVLAESIFRDAYVRIIDQGQPAGPVWSDAIARLNRQLAASSRGPVKEAVAWANAQWVTQDFNTVVAGETRVRSDGSLLVTAAGADLWDYRDGFRFVYQPVTGDFTATVRLHYAPDTDPWAKAGLMIRVAERPDSANVALLGTSENGLVMQVRRAPGELTDQVRAISWKNGDPIYLRLTRRGNEVIAETSRDGIRWSFMASTWLELPETVFVGPAVTSHNVARAGDALFSQWEITFDK